MVNPTTYAVEMQFSGAAGAWTDVTTDVRSMVPIRAKYGMAGVSPLDRVASTGEMVFALDNSAQNDAGKLGYYSPGHMSCRPGFGYSIGVRLSVTYAGITYYKFRGVLDSIQPVAGAHRERLTHCVAVDWMDEAARFQVRSVTLKTNQRSSAVFASVAGNIPLQPAASSIDTGIDRFPYAADLILNEHSSALTEFQKIAMSELAYIYVKGDTTQGGTLVFENRHHRSSIVTNATTLSDTMVELEVLRDRDDLLNSVSATVKPRRLGGSTVVLYALDWELVVPPNGASMTFWAPFRDPDQPGVRIGGLNTIAPVATTDYVAEAESNPALALTSFLTVTANFDANGAEVGISNAHPTEPAKITFLQLRGEALYAFDAEDVLLVAEDTASQAVLGQNGIHFEMPYQSDPNIGQGAADYFLHLYGDQTTLARGVSFIANTSSALMTAALAREIGDRVGIEETVTGLNDDIDWLDQDFEVALDVASFRINSNYQRYAMGFKSNPGAITQISLPLQRIGFPSGNIWIQIESDSGGDPSGAALATSQLIRSIDIAAGDFFWTDFRFPEATRYTVPSAATQFHFVLYSDMPLTGTDYVPVASYNSIGGYPNGDGKRYNGSTWTSHLDLNFRLYIQSPVAVRGYFINAVELEIQQPSFITCRWALTPADRQRYWTLGTSGASELDATAVLAYV